MTTRRDLLKASLPALAFGATGLGLPSRPGVDDVELDSRLADAQRRPVLKQGLFPDPVILESVTLLRNGKYFIVRARSTDGAEGWAVSNESRLRFVWPIFVGHVGPFFKGKDARNLDSLVQQCFESESFYKYQSLAIWIPIASAEFAILDLLGQVSGYTAGQMLGDPYQSEIKLYYANNHRGKSARESALLIKDKFDEYNPPAIKFKIGGRMSAHDEPPGRSEELIPLLRQTLGDDVVIYADANGGYSMEEAIRVGRLLEEIDAGFFEEPCPMDHIWETKAVADALDIDVAGGEQEDSMRRFRWMAGNDCVQVFQPDLFYFGGFIRSIKVARMAEVVGALCTPHMSRAGMGMLHGLHFASVVPNAGPHHEYKGPNREIPYKAPPGDLESVDGVMSVPTGPGLGVQIDPDWLDKSEVITEMI